LQDTVLKNKKKEGHRMKIRKASNAKFIAIILILAISIAASNELVFSAITTNVTISNSGQIIRAVNAASGSAQDIQAAINILGSSGGNVNIPAGTFTWGTNDEVTIPGGVNVFGASYAGCQGHENNWTSYPASTILVRNSEPTQAIMFTLDGSNGKASRVSSIQFQGIFTGGPNSDNDYGIAVAIKGMHDYRIDHSTFINWIQIAVMIQSTSTRTSYGVIDHCVVDNQYKTSGTGWLWGYGFYPGNDFYSYSNWNTNVANYAGHYNDMPANTVVMFVEDSHFSHCRHSTDAICGAWAVVRHNLFDSSVPPYGDADSHGSASWVSGRGFEVYNNTFLETPNDDNGVNGQTEYGNGDIAVRLRDGSGFVFNNTLVESPANTGGSQPAYFMYLDDDNAGNGNPFPLTKMSQTFIWSNTISGANFLNNRGSYTLNTNYFTRAPNQAQDGFSYVPYAYPHPLATQP
jgi:hypothetical protein